MGFSNESSQQLASANQHIKELRAEMKTLKDKCWFDQAQGVLNDSEKSDRLALLQNLERIKTSPTKI